MKTIVVLAALAAVAIAVPALPGYNGNRLPYRLNTPIKRELKSSELLDSDVSPAVNMEELDTTPELTARTFGLKKPIFFKKNIGLPVYRDSDDEKEANSDFSKENCAKEVKMKFCEPERLTDEIKTVADSTTPLADNKMKQTIKVAREAIESLQKITQLKNVEMSPNAEMHEDIEVARQALEHIQRNFGNLESMNLQATTLSEAEALRGASSKIAKTDGERMAQWKEAIDNIQKNTEIAKNIEDSFKASESELDSVNMKEIEGKEHIHEIIPVASKLTASKASLKEMPVKAKEAFVNLEDVAFEKKTETENAKQGKTVELDTHLSTLKEKSVNHDGFLKAKEHDIKTLENVKPVNRDDLAVAPSTPVMRTVSVADMDGVSRQFSDDFERSAWKDVNEKKPFAKSNENVPVAMINEKKFDGMSRIAHEKKAEIDTTMLMKSAEHIQKQDMHQENKMQDSNSELMPKSVEKQETASIETVHNENTMHHVALEESDKMHTPEMKSSSLSVVPNALHADHQTIPTSGKTVELNNLHSVAPALRVPESNNLQHQLQDSDLHFEEHAKNWHADQMKAKTEAFNNFETERTAANVGFHSGPMMNPSVLHPGHLVKPMLGPHVHPVYHQHHHHMTHGNPMIHGKSADMDSAAAPSSQINVEDITGKAAVNHGNMMNWKQKESARGAYGLGSFSAAAAAAAAASSASGLDLAASAGGASPAVGVFPGARTGGCAIPLLLSCSPSVVSGTLAHTSAYAAPHAYRSASEFDNRFMKKTNEFTSKVKRTPAKVIQKIPLDKKL